jgi:hypothetical protein
MEMKRLVTVNHLAPDKTYVVKKMNGKSVITATGAALNTKGFELILDKLYDGELFEISIQ